MKTGVVVLTIVLALVSLFLMPFWLTWVARELFNLDWSHKYWAVFSLIILIGILFNTGKK